MSEKQLRSDDEIDLFELFLTLWEGKWLILGATLLAAVLGFAYISLTPNKFEARLNIAPLSANDINDYSALNAIIAADLESTAKTGSFIPTYNSSRQPFFEVTGLYLANAFYIVLTNDPLSSIVGSVSSDLTNSTNEKDYLNSLADASRSFDATINQDGRIVITFQGKNEAFAQLIVETALEVAENLTKIYARDDFQNHTSKFSAQKVVILKELAVEKSIATSAFSKDIEHQISRLKEHLQIATALGIEDIFEKGGNNQAFNQSTQYLKGHKALEAEISMLQKRQLNESYLPDLQRINSALSLIETDETASLSRTALQETPLGEDKVFKAVEYNTDQMQFAYEKRPTLILALSIVLGGLLGMATVLVRHAFKARETVAS